ncbi:hypothetical protein SAMN05428978_11413, partial [Nitrosomonas sp. Nm34]
MKAGRIRMAGLAWQAELLDTVNRQLAIKRTATIRMDSIQRSAWQIIIQSGRGDALANQVFNRFVPEKMR